MNSTNEVKGKFEKEIRDLSLKVKDLNDQVFELENKLKDEEQTNTILKQEWH